ncbi:hypothetical protein ACJX0J_002464, partial (mitochondrion) [Zea mays]
ASLSDFHFYISLSTVSSTVYFDFVQGVALLPLIAPRLDDFPGVQYENKGAPRLGMAVVLKASQLIGSVVLKGEAFTLLLIWMIKRMILPWKWQARYEITGKIEIMQSISRNGMNEIYRSVSLSIPLSGGRV